MNARLPIIAAIALCAALLIGGLFLIFTSGTRAPEGEATSSALRDAIGGPFTLTNSKGETVTDQSFLGKYLMVFFGFTHCPDICPTTLDDMGRAMQALGPESARVTPIFISVDPERDTPEIVGDYVAFYDKRIVGLTGTLEQVLSTAKAYKVWVQKVELEGGDYSVDHSSFIVLMGPDGKFRALIRNDETPEQMAAEIKKVMKDDAE